MADGGGPDHKAVIGSVMVLVGLVFFVAIFIALFPVLSDPSGAYDTWFPPEEQAADSSQTIPTFAPDPVERAVVGPSAQFTWEAIGTTVEGPTATRVRVVSTSTPGDAEIVRTSWALGDGTSAIGESVTHDYSALGSYTVVLRVQDADGETDVIRGTIAATGDASGLGAAGRIADLESFDGSFDDLGSGITDSLELAVGDVGEDINETIDTALGSIGSTVRGGVVVALFALSALAATVVAWRTARIGVMLLTGDADARLGRSWVKQRRDDEKPPRRLEAA